MEKTFSVEGIAYQTGDKFFSRLTAICDRMATDVQHGLITSNNELIDIYGEEISKLIKSRFNLTVIPVKEFSELAPLAIIPFSSDLLNQLTNIEYTPNPTFFSYMENSQEVIIKKINEIMNERKKSARRINNKKGIIDLDKAYVSGYFAEVTHYLIINPVLLFKNGTINAAEFAAAIIHEIGHAFGGLESHYRLATTNVAVSQIMSSLEKNDVKRASYIFKSSFGAKELAEAALDKDPTREDFYGVLVDTYMKKLESHYASQRYDFVSFEFMSDNFATRMGAGKDLVSGLDKLNRAFNFGINRSALVFRITSSIVLAAMFVVMGAIGGPALVVAYGALMLMTQLLQAFVPEIYDNYKDRGTRVAQDIANILKDRSLPKTEIKMLVSQYELIEATNSVNKNFEPLFVNMWSKIIPSLRKAKYYKSMEQKIEAKLNNPIFVTSAKLESMK